MSVDHLRTVDVFDLLTAQLTLIVASLHLMLHMQYAEGRAGVIGCNGAGLNSPYYCLYIQDLFFSWMIWYLL